MHYLITEACRVCRLFNYFRKDLASVSLCHLGFHCDAASLGRETWAEASNESFLLSTYEASYDDAQLACKAVGAKLAEPNTMEKMEGVSC